jgi:hypothetical protein
MRPIALILIALSSVALIATVAGAAPARFCTCSGKAAMRDHGKPTAPLSISLTPLPRQKKDSPRVRRLRVSVLPLVNAEHLEVELTLPESVKLVHGSVRWQVPARARGPQIREVMLEVPTSGEQEIVATAKLLFKKSLPMTGVESYTYNVSTPPREPHGREGHAQP